MAQFPFRTAVAFLIKYNEKRDIDMRDIENMFANIWPLLELFADSSASARCSCLQIVCMLGSLPCSGNIICISASLH